MRFLLLLGLIAVQLSAADELPSGERWLPETLPDYVKVTVSSRPCSSTGRGHALWRIAVEASTENLGTKSFYLLPYLWDRKSGELLVLSGSLASEARKSTHMVDLSFHPRLLDQVVVLASIDAKHHLILASDFSEGHRCS